MLPQHDSSQSVMQLRWAKISEQVEFLFELQTLAGAVTVVGRENFVHHKV